MQNALLAAALTISIFALIGLFVLGLSYVSIIAFTSMLLVCAVILFIAIYYTLTKNDKDDCTDF